MDGWSVGHSNDHSMASMRIWTSISKRGQEQLSHRLAQWPINCCTAERGLPSIEYASQVVIERPRPYLSEGYARSYICWQS